MGFFDFLTGKTRLEQPKLEKLFAITTAAVTIETDLGLAHAGHAAVCFKPLSSRRFRESGQDITAMLTGASADFGSKVNETTDAYGYEWLVIDDPDIDNLVTEINLVAQTLQENGFGEQLLCVVFAFGDASERVRLIYNFKRGLFYPFVQTGQDRRDNARELELRARLERELPFEPELERWFPLYGAPV